MKSYYEQQNIGLAKYLVNFYDGIKTYKDGSNFYDIRIFKNKVKKNAFIKKLEQNGYKVR